jgi:rubrerythrin
MATPPGTKRERLLALFKLAIAAERDAQTLYAEMAEHCEDADLAHVIESLRASEQAHEELLLDQYAALRQTSQFRE